KRVFDDAAKLLDFDLLSVCFDVTSDKLTETRYSQPSISVTSLAALAVLKAHPRCRQFEPRFVAGLSLGEATALCAAEAIGFEDGVRFVRDRGLFMETAARENPGMMAAVLGLELSIVEKVCAQSGAEVGNLNAPGQIVISGPKANLEEAIVRLKEAGARKAIPLDVSGAFHSRCMDSACQKIAKALETVTILPPKIPIVSNLTAAVETHPDDIKRNLVHQMNHRTLWEDSMRYLIGQGIKTFIEFGPGKVLKGLLKKIDPAVETIPLGTLDDFHALDAQKVAV
ncbi:MAG: ACP S-malonyltransferase, partial [Candidatus Omnitrophota bacterium]